MTKKEFIKAVAERLEVPVRVADQYFDAFLFVLKEELIAENKVQLSNLGIFETKIRRGRETINPFTSEELSVPEKRVVKFTPSKYLKELVNF
ncbi:HU family DNA-binding protein [Mycoplasmopsis felifaucium]|uniref:HU family DNA-binding protein n=1 Tax=Mycoplasmopsis felifaucium TaxID=35768 RepID=A0ABZ2RSR3_9BACT|nr:HU family DNA-binding protein [Mycoplasmopsis felifaucium]